MGCKRILNIFLLAVFIFGMAAPCHAQKETSNLKRLFYRGNDLYEKGEYSEAAAQYENILKAGYQSGPLYYNLGNTYFKMGDMGKAVLNYERARRLIPRDADLNANYRFARAKILGKILEKKGIWNWTPLKFYAGNFTIDEFLWMTSVLYIFILVLLMIAVRRPMLKARIFAIALCLFLLGAANSVIVWHKASGIGREAIVTSYETESRYGPFDSATAFFKLYEGMKVKVLKVKGEWEKVERPDGKAGWVKKQDLAVI
jgi:tetratricopeptide (TPR) repeat protein